MLFGLSWRSAPQQILALLMLPSLGGAAVAEVKAAAKAPEATLSVAPPTVAAQTPKTGSGEKAVSKADAAVAKAEKPEVALDGDQMRTRFIIGLGKTVQFQVFALSNPNRVIIDLDETALWLPDLPNNGVSVGLVNSFRAGSSAPGKARVVIDVAEPVVVESAKLEKAKGGKGPHLALEILPAYAAAKASNKDKKPLKVAPFALGAVGLQPPVPMPAVRPDVRAAKAFKPIIVIDPGHGGHDSGAMKNGAVEKEVVLAFSKALKDKLEKTGRYKVMMTRDSDVFVELGERVSYAERHNANLFIAVHADYSGENSKARGATIYSLRESVANSLQRSAKGEVSDNVLTKDEAEAVRKVSLDNDVSAVKTILADLAGREVSATKERTNIFTRSVIEYMGASTGLRSEPDQQAAFRVLKTAKFPSVLIELAYVTNKEDAALLQSDVWRNKVSDSIMTAVENYFSNQIARLPL
jgi:N-acetylmuramoyl-L-alanine amidase